MADIFISYSRQNNDFVRRLYEALDRAGRDVWIDWESIPRGEEFLKTIYDGVDSADVFLFVVSRHSLTSEICNLEVRHARRRQKKIIPVVIELIEGDVFNAVVAGWFKKAWETDARDNWDVLKAINWAIFTPDRDFEPEFKALIEEIETDRPHVRLHTRYLIASRDWQFAGSTASLLLIGDQVDAAEIWLRDADGKTPAPTPEQREYIIESRKAEERRVQRERRQRRVTLGLVLATLLAVLIGIPSVIVSVSSMQRAFDAEMQATRVYGDVVRYGATLTPIPRTLTPIAETLAAGEAQIAVVGTQVREAQDFAAGLRIAAIAQQLYNTGGNYALALALALKASEISPTAQTERLLSEIAYAPGARFVVEAHTDWVTDAAYSPDGTRFVSVSQDGTAILWDAVTGALIEQIEVSRISVDSVAFSPDGSQFATGATDGTIILWDAVTGDRVRTLYDGMDFFFARGLAFSPDGTQLAVGTGNYTVVIFDVASGRILDTLAGHSSDIARVAYSLDGKSIISASWDNTLILWDAVRGEQITRLEGHTEWVNDAAFNPDGTLIASIAFDGLILWDASTGEMIRRIDVGSDGGTGVAFSADGTRLATGQIDGSITIWNTATGEPITQLVGHTSSVTRVAFSVDGFHLISASWDRRLIEWDLRSGALVHRLSGHSGGISSLEFSHDGQQLVSTSNEDIVARVWDVTTGTEAYLLEPDSVQTIGAATYSPDGSLIVTAVVMPDGTALMFWNATTGEMVRLVTTDIRVFALGYRLDGQQFAIGGSGEIVTLHDGTTGEAISTLDNPDLEAIWSIAYSPDGSQLAIGGFSGQVNVWDGESGTLIRTLDAHTEGIHVVYNPDGTRLAVASRDGTLSVWDAATGEMLHRYDGQSGGLTSVRYTPDGSRLIVGTDQGVLLIWDAERGELLRRIETGADGANELVLNPDGRLIAVGTYDGEVYLWRNDTLGQLQEWTHANRYIPELTCEQVITYGLPDDQQCGSDDNGQ